MDVVPIVLSKRTIERLEENNPIYKFVDFWFDEEFEGSLNTITIEQYDKMKTKQLDDDLLNNLFPEGN